MDYLGRAIGVGLVNELFISFFLLASVFGVGFLLELGILNSLRSFLSL
jgi:hypothetical protein